MAGSWKHITTDKGEFRGVELIDNLGDAYETLEECYGMVWYLVSLLGNDPTSRTMAADIEEARLHYKDGIELSPGVKKEQHKQPRYVPFPHTTHGSD